MSMWSAQCTVHIVAGNKKKGMFKWGCNTLPAAHSPEALPRYKTLIPWQQRDTRSRQSFQSVTLTDHFEHSTVKRYIHGALRWCRGSIAHKQLNLVRIPAENVAINWLSQISFLSNIFLFQLLMCENLISERSELYILHHYFYMT